MIEITYDEKITTAPVERKIMHSYEETIDATLLTYSLEEIIMEKLRGILQKTKKSHEKNWTRSRARDYYDLWNIFRSFGSELDLDVIRTFLPVKCRVKDVNFNNVDDFFDPWMIKKTAKDWDGHLSYLVSDLPDFDIVKEELYNDVSIIISGV